MLDRLAIIFLLPNTLKKQLKALLEARERLLRKLRMRQLIILVGEANWSHQLVAESNGKTEPFVFSEQESVTSTLSPKNIKQCLGSEVGSIAYFAKTFEPETFAVLSGLIKAGGTFFLSLTPECLEQSCFARYFLAQARQDKCQLVVEQHQTIISDESSAEHLKLVLDARLNTEVKLTEISDDLCLTFEQQASVDLIVSSVQKKRQQIATVITADRGRGKSTALAIACSRLLVSAKRQLRIGVTAPNKQSLVVFYQQLENTLTKLMGEPANVQQALNQVSFYAIDDLILNRPELDLLCVDEAAGIPVPLLEQLASHYKKTVFSSTVHGYEGAGRGFTVKFLNFLATHQKQLGDKFKLQSHHLTSPIRWATGCPLEQFSFESLLLNAEIAPLLNANLDKKLAFFKPSKARLVDDKGLLKQVFALLVNAHYQTSTSDLKLLLDNDLIDLFCLATVGEAGNEQIIGVALMIKEQVLPKAMHQGVIDGDRRVRDHFTAQSLVQHLGFYNALDLSFYRVMRIAIHPELQQRKLGQRLLAEIELVARETGFDALSTSFGVNQNLFRFWHKNGYTLARLGSKKDHASGEYSGLLIKPLTEAAISLQVKFSESFERSFITNIRFLWPDLSAALMSEILQTLSKRVVDQVTPFDEQSILDFGHGRRQLLPCLFSLRFALVAQLGRNFDKELLPLVDYLLRNMALSSVYKNHDFTGKKDFISYCRKASFKLLDN